MFIENRSFVDAFYYIIVTMATVSYGDINRAYHLLVHQWVDYMEYLKENYPYLFSLAYGPIPLTARPLP